MVSAGRSLFSCAGRRVTGFAVAVGCLVGCEPEPLIEEVVRPVRYQEVAVAESGLRRAYSGTTQAELEIDLSFRVGGRLDSRPVDVGDVVMPGNLVGELDPADYEARVQAEEARRELARAAVTNAQAELDRVRLLYENNSVSQRDYDAAIAAADSARAQLDAAEQQLEVARLQLAYTELTAPQECRVARTLAEINQNVAPGQTIVRLNCGECAEVSVSVPEVDIDRISEGDSVSVRINALDEPALSGFVRDVAVDTGPTGTTYPVTVGLLEQCGNVRAGMAAEVEFELQSSGPENALVVPFVAVGEHRDTGDNFVFVLEPAGDELWTATQRVITVGEPTPAGLVVVDGLSAGELIVTAGVRRLEPGATVRLLEQESAEGIR